MHLDLTFPLTATRPIPADHGYPLYAALSRRMPELHASNGIAVHPIAGRQTGNRELMLTDRSRLALRVPEDRIGPLVQLAGKELEVAGTKLRVGVPQVRPLIPAPTLRSRLVVIKIKDTPAAEITPENFRSALRRKLDALGLSPEVNIVLPKRDKRPLRTLRIKHREVAGYEVILEGLTAEESLIVQENRAATPHEGLSRRHMGCGVFVAVKTDGEEQ